MFQNLENLPNANQKVIAHPNLPRNFGLTIAIDWALRDGLGPNAKNVARAQGMALGSSIDGPKGLMCHNIVFTDERLKGSTLTVLGNVEEEDRGVWSIVGGTGEFSYAQGDFTETGKWDIYQGGPYSCSVPHFHKADSSQQGWTSGWQRREIL